MRIIYLACVFLLVFSDTYSYQDPCVDLEKIIITNKRAPASANEATEDVEVVTDNQIERLPAKELSDILSYVPGVNIEPRQGFGQGVSVSMQGSDSRQVRVMIDGMPFNNQASGQVDLAKFPIEDIARIEVIKGPASSVWGSALGGVINIITKDPGSPGVPKISTTEEFAEFRTRKNSAEVSGVQGPLGFYLSSSYLESAGTGIKSDSLQKNGFGKISYKIDDEDKLVSSYGYSGSDVNTGIFPDGTWQSQDYQARYGKISWQRDLGYLSFNADLKRVDQDIVTRQFITADDTEPLSIIRTKDGLSQLSLNLSLRPREKDLFVAGIDADWHSLKSVYLSKEKDLTAQAPYMNYTLVLFDWDLNAGFRFDHNSEFGQQLSPSFGALYHFRDPMDTSARVNVSRAFNAPPLLWKHYDLILSGLATNPDIKPERAWVYETGLETNPNKALKLKLSLYRADVSNAINISRNDSGDFFMKNFQKFLRQGAEFESSWKLTQQFSVIGSCGFNDEIDRSTKTIVRGGGKPRQTFSLALDYKNKHGLDIYVHSYYDRWNEPPESLPNDRKMLADARVSQEFSNVTLFLNIYNISNSKYWADFFFPVPGRYFEGGFTLKW